MLTCAVRHILQRGFHRPLQWKTSAVAISKAIPSGTYEIPPILLTLERSFCAPAWHQPLGKVTTPRKQKAQSRSSEIVPIENLVDQRSLRVLEDIHDAVSAAAVFQAVQELGRDLTEVHVAQAIIKLSKIHSQMSSRAEEGQENATQLVTMTEDYRLSVHRDKEFLKLCHLTLRHARAMDSNSLTNVLKAMMDLGIPQSSTMVQTLLVNAEHRLNHLNCDELAMLAGKLSSMQQSDQRVAALLQAIVLLAPTHIESFVNVHSLNTLLSSIGKHLDQHTLSQMAIRCIAILKAKVETDPHRVVKDATNAMFTMQSLGYHNKEFLREACEILTAYIDYLPPAMLRRLLTSLSSWQFYCPSLLEKAGDLLAGSLNEWSFNDLGRILASYSLQRFLHKNLLNKVATSVCERSLEGVQFGTLIKLVTPFAKFQHTPTDIGVFDFVVDAAEDSLESEHDGLRVDYGQLVGLTGLLAMCGSFSPNLVMRVLSRQSFESSATEEAGAHLQLLRAMIYLDRPELVPSRGLSPSDTDQPVHLSFSLDAADRASEDANTKGNDKLKVSLADVLKDVTLSTHRCLATDVTVGYGYVVDFLITDKEKTGQSVAIDLTRHGQYCANFPDRPLGREIIKKRHLAALGFSLHMIHRSDWVFLASYQDKAEYVRGILRLLP